MREVDGSAPVMVEPRSLSRKSGPAGARAMTQCTIARNINRYFSRKDLYASGRGQDVCAWHECMDFLSAADVGKSAMNGPGSMWPETALLTLSGPR